MGKKRTQKHPGDDGGKMLVRSAYHTAHGAITRPDDIFAFPMYFLYHWVPLLGPGLAWLVTALKERADGRGRVRWRVSDLAKEIGVSGSTVRRWLNREYARWFVGDPRKRNALRELVADFVHGPPPAPQHLVGAAALLQRHLPPGRGDRVEAAMEAMQTILDAGQVHRQVLEAAGTSPWRVNGGPLTMLQVVWQVADLPPAESVPREQRSALFKLSVEIEAEITLAGFYGCGTNYFRRSWVPLLGTAAAWLVVYLRNYNRGDPGIKAVHDRQMGDQARVVTVSAEKIAAITGRSLRSLPGLLEGGHVPEFVRLEEQREARLTFRVRAGDPLAPGTEPQRMARQVEGGWWVPLPGFDLDDDSGENCNERTPEGASN
jgi:hypothetical protein